MTTHDAALARALGSCATPLYGGADDYDAVIDALGDAELVLIGAASHGTHEFYRERAQLTKRLIVDKSFVAVAAEADWPDAYRINRYVHGRSDDEDAVDALGDFRRFPQWMWRNADVLDFVGWLREHNDARPAGAAAVGFYGVDLYSLHASMQAVLAHLDRVDPAAAAIARERYACFEEFGDDPHAYAYATRFDLSRSCEDEVVAQLVEMQRRRGRLRDGILAEDEQFAAEQNARVVARSEAYYRAMFGGRVNTWNLRDTHMADALDDLLAHLLRRGPAKLVVWAHNSHLGDARATSMGDVGELNLGQLVRQRHRGRSIHVGLTTSVGTVSAASDWDLPVERKTVRPPLDKSYEALFHSVELPRFFVDLRPDDAPAIRALGQPRLERAIGVIYKPETERYSHYFRAQLREQFDLLLHFDHTRAVEPLERTGRWEIGELPETYPSSL
jgi:erythromycin esterase-like protein